MPREKFQALTEQMFYILLCLKDECCGMDIMTKVDQLTLGRVRVGPGTLYNLLEQFAGAGVRIRPGGSCVPCPSGCSCGGGLRPLSGG